MWYYEDEPEVEPWEGWQGGGEGAAELLGPEQLGQAVEEEE